MSSCSCPKTAKSYYQWKCAIGEYKECKGHKSLPLKCQQNSTVIKVSQFQKVKTEYINKKGEKKKVKPNEVSISYHPYIFYKN